MKRVNLIISTIKRYRVAYLLITPALIYFLCFGVYPLINSLYLSFHQLNLLVSPVPKFVGVRNYINIFQKDAHFKLVFINTLIWVFGSTILQFSLGLATALLLHQKIKGRGLFRGIMLIPWVTPVIIVGFIWRWMLDPTWGLINYYLYKFGFISKYIVWLGRDDTVWPALLFASMWKGFPYMTVLLLAGLQVIPEELYEAANVEGANTYQRFIHITLPLIKPAMAVTVLVAIIETWNNFRVIWVLTEGGPGYATSVLSTYVYTRSFHNYQFGEGATISAISFAFVLLFSLIYLKLVSGEE